MSIKQQLSEDIKNAMRAKDTPRLSALRLLHAAIRQREVDERIELVDADVVAVIEKMLKQRRDSITQFAAASRQDLVDAETFEVSVLTEYMPQPLSDAEIEALLAQAIATSGAADIKDMGKVMALIKPLMSGRADMGKVSALIKGKLSG